MHISNVETMGRELSNSRKLGVCNVVGFKLRIILLLFSVSLLYPLTSPAQAIQPTAVAIEGTVSTAGDTDPIPVSGAKIVLYGETGAISTVTDVEGKFSFTGVAPGTYFLRAKYLGLRAEQKIQIDSGMVVQVAVQLDDPNAN